MRDQYSYIKIQLHEQVEHIAKSKLVAIKATVTAETYQGTMSGKKVWRAVPPEYLENLYKSMPRRMAAVIAAGGRHTKY